MEKIVRTDAEIKTLIAAIEKQLAELPEFDIFGEATGAFVRHEMRRNITALEWALTNGDFPPEELDEYGEVTRWLVGQTSTMNDYLS